MMKKQLLLLLLTLAFSINFTNAQEDANEDSPIKVDTLLLTIPLTVKDEKGRNIPGLKKENFTIFEDGDAQDIEFFFNEEAPMNVAILLDTSFSTRKVLDKIQKAARDFIKIFRPGDKGVIVGFNYRTSYLSEFTGDRKKLSNAIEQARIADSDGSDMYDAISSVVNNHFAGFKGRKAIIVLTDGIVGGKLSTQQTLRTLQKSDTVFYPIIFKSGLHPDVNRNKKPLPIQMLGFLAEESGGKFYEKDSTNLKEAFQSISEEIKKQYLIGFYPQHSARRNTLGHIRIAVEPKEFRIESKKIAYLKMLAEDEK